MKMGDGGFRPALNVQTATAGSELGGPRTVLAVQVTNVVSDMGAMTPMLEPAAARTGQVPETLLADAHHAKHEAIVAAMAQGIDVVVPVPTRSSPSTARQNEEPEIQAWKDRRKTDDAKEPYRARPGLCEWTNAQFAGRFDWRQFLVRGLDKATSVALLAAITSNLMQHLATLANGSSHARESHPLDHAISLPEFLPSSAAPLDAKGRDRVAGDTGRRDVSTGFQSKW